MRRHLEMLHYCAKKQKPLSGSLWGFLADYAFVEKVLVIYAYA